MNIAVIAIFALIVAVPARAGPADDKALWDAALAHDIEGVRIALKNGADPNAPSVTGRRKTVLGVAAMGTWRLTRNRAMDLTKNATAAKLSQGGFSDEDIDKYLAVEVTKMLFAAGAKISIFDKTILFLPIAGGNVELVDLLIDKGASVTADLEGYSPTELAKKYGHEAVYNLLIARGGIPVDSGSSAQLALIDAAENADVEGMKRAIKNGARVNGFDANNTTALIWTIRWGIFESKYAYAIWWLLEQGADPNLKGESKIQDLEGVPLHVLVAMNKRPFEDRLLLGPLAEGTLSRLLKAGAKVSGVDSIGRTPLHIAAQFDNLRAAEILIKAGAKVMPKDVRGKTPLDYAESAAMIKLLKQHGATER